MPNNGTIDINLTLKAWADIVLQKWYTAIIDINVVDEGLLRDSLKYTLFVNAGNNIDRIDLSFKLYGFYIGALYGKGLVKKNNGEKDNWFADRYFAQVMRLKEILAEKYSRNIVFSLVEIMEAETTASLKSIVVKRF